ncbi:amidohydrolase [Tenacibaculum sp. MEBiC06402]|uniref:amidohydrolase n=1 Tax=unclassified Tenacibaculum TaxID=2635139 RepID=UPI003B9B120B
MNALNISLLQADLSWENPQENLSYFSSQIEQINNDVDLIVLPEMFTTGFSMNASELAEEMNGTTIKWMKEVATKKDSAVIGSIIISENSAFYNRLFFVFPSGEFQYYDKKHTFTLAKEHETYSAGKQKLLVEYKDWKICPLICYDLRFPVWGRNVEDYDLLIYVASWPEKRINAWDALLKARAIENMSYTIGVNRVGKDGNDYAYVGHSIAFDCLGKALTKELNEDEGIISIQINKDYQEEIRNKLGFLKDRDTFTFSY